MPEKCPEYDEGSQISFLSKLKPKMNKHIMEGNVRMKKNGEKRRKKKTQEEWFNVNVI